MKKIKTCTEIFEHLGGPAKVAEILAVGNSTAKEMKRRGVIRTEHWRTLVQASADLDQDDWEVLTLSTLAEIFCD